MKFWIIFVIFGLLMATVIISAGTVKPEPSLAKLVEVVEGVQNNPAAINVCDKNNANNSFIYCYGQLLAAVNVHKLFPDPKTFVDMPMKKSPYEILSEFERLFGQTKLEAINRDQLEAFVNESFLPAGSELETCELSEWQEFPPKLMKIRDETLRNWALKLNAIWKSLCRKMRKTDDENRHSLIYVPEEFIVPGGRFREFYYWDAYWIVKGLAACGMKDTIKKMIINFVSVVKKYGFVPNGGRVYYLARSQPPMLIPMAYEYFELTHDVAFIKEIMPSLIEEYHFWRKHRTLNVTSGDETFSVFQYHTKSNVPRPESYLIDIKDAVRIPAEKRPQFFTANCRLGEVSIGRPSLGKLVHDSLTGQFRKCNEDFRDIASAAESGWDFSSRWFRDGMTIDTIETTQVIPVDLNAFICWNLDILQYLLKQEGNRRKSKIFHDERETLRAAMTQVFYNSTEGAWFDYNLGTKSQNTRFYASIAVPLFGECYQPLNLAGPQRIVEYFNKSGVYDYAGGVPTSLVKGTGQQWDFPNGWSTLNHMVIEGMRKSSNPVVQEEAFRLAQKWISGNYKVFARTGHMWEKYDVIGAIPQPGGGGEYSVQDGFGWSNGVILDLLTTYYDRMTLEPSVMLSDPSSGSDRLLPSNIWSLLVICLIAIFARMR